MARPTSSEAEVRVSVAAAARRLGVAPATLRTWDRRYGIGPSERLQGQHRRYSAADLARLEAMRTFLLQGATAAEAASAVGAGARPVVSTPTPRRDDAEQRPADTGARARALREATLQMDAERIVELLTRAVRERGVLTAWDDVLRPTLAGLGNRWAAEGTCVAEEHLLSECATRVLHAVQGEHRVATVRPALLACAPGEAHALPLHALAGALAERGRPSRILGAGTPADALGTAVRRLAPAAVVIWAQAGDTADPGVFAALPRIRGGCRAAAAGPGWDGVGLPRRVLALGSLGDALAVLSDDAPPA